MLNDMYGYDRVQEVHLSITSVFEPAKFSRLDKKTRLRRWYEQRGHIGCACGRSSGCGDIARGSHSHVKSLLFHLLRGDFSIGSPWKCPGFPARLTDGIFRLVGTCQVHDWKVSRGLVKGVCGEGVNSPQVEAAKGAS